MSFEASPYGSSAYPGSSYSSHVHSSVRSGERPEPLGPPPPPYPFDESIRSDSRRSARDEWHTRDSSHQHEEPKWILREEVPFERWIYHAYEDLNEDDTIAFQTRLHALGCLAESALKVSVEKVAFVIAKFLERAFGINAHSGRHLKVGNLQLRSLQFCAQALVDPESALEDANLDGRRPLFGCLENRVDWGTPYDGVRTKYLAFDCCDSKWRNVRV